MSILLSFPRLLVSLPLSAQEMNFCEINFQLQKNVDNMLFYVNFVRQSIVLPAILRQEGKSAACCKVWASTLRVWTATCDI
jgi:hypothetical protein